MTPVEISPQISSESDSDSTKKPVEGAALGPADAAPVAAPWHEQSQ